MTCPCGCGRELPSSLGQFPFLLRETGAADALVDRFELILREQGRPLARESVEFRAATAELHKWLQRRCHGAGGISDGISLGKRCQAWRISFGAFCRGFAAIDPAYYDWWRTVGIVAWPNVPT